MGIALDWLGLRIQHLRVQKKLSRSRLATKVGVSQQQIYRWEQQPQMIKVVRLYEIAEALDTTVLALLNAPTQDEAKSAIDSPCELAPSGHQAPSNDPTTLRQRVSAALRLLLGGRREGTRSTS